MDSMSLETAETIRVVGYLNELAEKTRHGFMKFSEVTPSSEVKGIVYDDSGDNEVVLDMIVDEMHHDIVSFYEDVIGGATFVIEDDTGTYVQVGLPRGFVIIEDGHWYFCP